VCWEGNKKLRNFVHGGAGERRREKFSRPFFAWGRVGAVGGSEKILSKHPRWELLGEWRSKSFFFGEIWGEVCAMGNLKN